MPRYRPTHLASTIEMTIQDGFFVIDKPEGVTSHDVVQGVRRRLKLRKVGHLGTLDPMATGVLPVACSKATRLIQFLSGGTKVYRGTIRLGFSTTTFDRDGKPTSAFRAPDYSLDQLEEIGKQLLGEQLQVPPSFSAKKVGGVRSYRLARQGVEVPLPPQRIRVFQLKLVPRLKDEIDFEIHCSPGTYIRSIAHDLGRKLECGAHLIRLRRSAHGSFSLDQAIGLSAFADFSSSELAAHFISMNRVLQDLPELVVCSEIQDHISHGRDFAVPEDTLATQRAKLYRMVTPQGELLGLAEVSSPPSSGQPEDPSLVHFHPKLVLWSSASS